MDVRRESEATPTKNRTGVERKSERELVVTRTVNAPARLVFEAWTKAELFRRWWVPKSYGLTLLSCEMDVRVGGQYRLVFRHQDSTMEFFGTYLEVTPHSRLVWTNEEGDDGKTVTTEKVGRVRTCKLGLRGLQEEAAWIERYRQLWGARFDELDKVVEELKTKEKVDGRKKRK